MRYFTHICACLALLWPCLPASAQHCSDAKGISTNPSAPVNPESVPADPEEDPCGVLNTFDWRKALHPILNSNGQSSLAVTPYQALSDFSTPELTSFLDNEPEDGWELIVAGEEFLPQQEADYAYFVLYNKYGSFLRIFFTFKPVESGQATTVNLRF